MILDDSIEVAMLFENDYRTYCKYLMCKPGKIREIGWKYLDGLVKRPCKHLNNAIIVLNNK